MSPHELLVKARALAVDGTAGTRGLWPLAATVLARQALEGALAELWRRRGVPQVADASGRAQLLCLPSFIDPGLAAEVAWTWSALSEAAHEHGLMRTPTAGELGTWTEVVERFIARTA